MQTRVCSSCFGSTNSVLGTLQVLDGLFFGCGLLFPLILSFHRPCAPRQPRWSLSHHFGHDPSHSMHLANEFGLGSRIRFIFPCPAIRNLLLPLICLNVLSYICMIRTYTLFLWHLSSPQTHHSPSSTFALSVCSPVSCALHSYSPLINFTVCRTLWLRYPHKSLELSFASALL